MSDKFGKGKSSQDDDLSNESVEVLRERLNAMKRLVAERQQQSNSTPDTTEFWKSTKQTSGIIDGNFLSIAFGGALLTIICVSIYAFYNLYHAVLKKFPSKHTEL
ncbi:CLUMA_CG006538, isoform A [Clunio marinus]|uniref:CLUMA_CG006538, isoform A n=1 Tax=Clunio marinus TaxID=568069 RepID=A0A1J1HY41_9DIPT|nr:CLUMA_CG006538, isoform A [Clunio marinus]